VGPLTRGLLVVLARRSPHIVAEREAYRGRTGALSIPAVSVKTMRVTWVSAALALLLTAGCAGEKASQAKPSPSPRTGVDLAEPVTQDRLDATRRLLTIPLINRGPGALHVDKVGFDSPRFSTVPAAAVDGELEVGQQINFSIPYGTAQCTPKSSAEAVVVTAAGTTVRLAVAKGAGSRIVDRLWRDECGEQRLAAAFTVGWGPAWTQVPGKPGGAARLRGELILTPTGDPDITATDLQGSVLFEIDTVPAGRRPMSELRAGASRLPVELGVRLCSKHGLTEAKRIFEFTLHAKFGDAQPDHRTIIPPAAVQQRLLALLKTCPPEF
jgi:hypothetical protein